jgi:hypothetical protein
MTWLVRACTAQDPESVVMNSEVTPTCDGVAHRTQGHYIQAVKGAHAAMGARMDSIITGTEIKLTYSPPFGCTVPPPL